MPRATAVARKYKCKNCSMSRVLFSHDVGGEGESEKRETRPQKSVVQGGMRASSYGSSSTATSSSVDSATSAIRSPPSTMSYASDLDCGSGGSGVNSRTNSVSCGADTIEHDHRSRTSPGKPHRSEDFGRSVSRNIAEIPGKEFWLEEHPPFEELTAAEFEDALDNEEFLEEYEEDEDSFLLFVSDDQIEKWYATAHQLAQVVEGSCAEEPEPKFVDNLSEFAEAIHLHEDSDSFRVVLGIMADRFCDDADTTKLINTMNPARFAIPFLDQVGPYPFRISLIA